MTNQANAQNAMSPEQIAQIVAQTLAAANGAPQAPAVDPEVETKLEEIRAGKLKQLQDEAGDATAALEAFIDASGYGDGGDTLLFCDKIASNAAYSYFSTRAAAERTAAYEVSRPSNFLRQGEGSQADDAAIDMADRQASMKQRIEASLTTYFAAQVVAQRAAHKMEAEELDKLCQYLRAPTIDATDRAFNQYFEEQEKRRNTSRQHNMASAKMSASALLFS